MCVMGVCGCGKAIEPSDRGIKQKSHENKRKKYEK